MWFPVGDLNAYCQPAVSESSNSTLVFQPTGGCGVVVRQVPSDITVTTSAFDVDGSAQARHVKMPTVMAFIWIFVLSQEPLGPQDKRLEFRDQRISPTARSKLLVRSVETQLPTSHWGRQLILGYEDLTILLCTLQLFRGFRTWTLRGSNLGLRRQHDQPGSANLTTASSGTGWKLAGRFPSANRTLPASESHRIRHIETLRGALGGGRPRQWRLS